MTIITGRIFMSVHPCFDIDMLILTQEAHQEKLITKTHAGEFKRLPHQYNYFIRVYCDTSVYICKPQRKKKHYHRPHYEPD